MRLGGVILASLGILITVLVANGRWSTVWAAMLGDTTAGGSGSASGSTYTGPAMSNASFGTYGSEAPTVSAIP